MRQILKAAAVGFQTRRIISIAALLVFVAAGWFDRALAQTAPGARPPGMKQADVHNPFSPRYAGNRAQNQLRRNAQSNQVFNNHHGSHHHGHHHHYQNNFILYPPYYFSYNTGRYYRSYGYPYNYGYPNYYPYPQPYPVYVPQYIPVPVPQQQPVAQQQPQPANPDPPASNETARDRSRRLLNHGDARLASGDYFRALQRYKSAARAADDQPDAFFRQGQAYVALGIYDRAADAIREGIRLLPEWAKTDYSLAEAYQNDLDALDTHRDAILEAVRKDPRNADLWFLLGVYEFFEGNRDAAGDAFDRAFDLGPEDRNHLRQFRAELGPQLPPAAPADEAPAEEGVEI